MYSLDKCSYTINSTKNRELAPTVCLNRKYCEKRCYAMNAALHAGIINTAKSTLKRFGFSLSLVICYNLFAKQYGVVLSHNRYEYIYLFWNANKMLTVRFEN